MDDQNESTDVLELRTRLAQVEARLALMENRQQDRGVAGGDQDDSGYKSEMLRAIAEWPEVVRAVEDIRNNIEGIRSAVEQGGMG